MPRKFLPNRRATTAVVPDPMNGSRTIPPGGQLARIGFSHSDSGNGAKCPSNSYPGTMYFLGRFSVCRLQTSGGFFPFG
jgi:hypothetical protein